MILYDSTLITPTTGLMIWTLVTFVIVLIVLREYAFGPIQQMIDARRQAIVADLDAAESARTEAQEALAEYRQQLAEARKEAGKIVEDARRVGDERADGGRRRARGREGAADAADAGGDPGRDAPGAQRDQAAGGRLAVAATEKVVRARLDEAEQRRLIEEALADVDLSTLVPPEPAGGVDGRHVDPAGRVYANALHEAAGDAGRVPEVDRDLRALVSRWARAPSSLRALVNPALPAKASTASSSACSRRPTRWPETRCSCWPSTAGSRSSSTCSSPTPSWRPTTSRSLPSR